MKVVLGVLVLLLGLLLPLSAYAWSEMPDREEPGDYYELTYAHCASRYANSAFSESEIDCLCSELAQHTSEWRRVVPADQVPPLPDEVEASCLSNK